MTIEQTQEEAISTPKSRFSPGVEGRLIKIFQDEVTTGVANRGTEDIEFEALMDLFDAIRSEKDYEWMSDMFIPQFPSQVLTQLSMDISDYFQSREYVEVYLSDKASVAQAEAAKELMNRTLNRRNLYHFYKYNMARLMTIVTGRCYLHCWWEQEIKRVQDGVEEIDVPTNVDDLGNPITRLDQVPSTIKETRPKYRQVVLRDHFNYEVLDPRNVTSDISNVPSLQEKRWVDIRFERTLDELQRSAKEEGYFNLDLIENDQKQNLTSVASETYAKYESKNIEPSPTPKPLEVHKRFGKFWITPSGMPGIKENGEVIEEAEFEEVIATYVTMGSTTTLIGFHPTPYISATGQPYRPIIRGLCYIHFGKDSGVGDGKYGRELQIAVNDTFNLINDRTRLATMPTFKIKRGITEDGSTHFFAPGHGMEVEDKDDITEFTFQDNIAGGIQQIAFLSQRMNEVMSIYPSTQGQLPALASTTATAIAETSKNTSIRSNLKSLTFENTCLIDFYWMIQQMTWAFALPETAIKLMGDKVYSFAPERDDYFYRPVTSAIETEYARQTKIRNLTEIMRNVISIQHPDAIKVVNLILFKILSLMGDEYEDVVKGMFDPNTPMTQGGGSQTPEATQTATTNQSGLPQSSGEEFVREASNVG